MVTALNCNSDVEKWHDGKCSLNIEDKKESIFSFQNFYQ